MKRFMIVLATLMAVTVGSAEGKGGGRGGHSSHSHSGPGTASSHSTTHVNGYTKKDGTHVQPHHRSAADGKFENNYTTKPNVNPFTGQPGTRVTPPRK